MYYVLNKDSELVGVTPFDWVSLPGVSVDAYEGEIPNLNKVYWDKETLKLVLIAETVVSKLEFMSRFTTEERIAIRESADSMVIDAMELLKVAENVTLSDPRTVQLVQYMASIGLILSDRVSEILA